MSKTLKALLATIAIILPALFTWLETRARADEEKIKAAITYTILQDSVKELQAASRDQALQLAFLRGKMERSNGSQNKMPVKLSVDTDSIADAPMFMKVPDYKDAVQPSK